MFFNFNRFTKGSFNPSRGKNLVNTKSSYSNLYGGNYNLNRYNTSSDDLTSDSVLEQWLPKTPEQLHKLFRIIHRFDSIAGPAVDLISIMPFSEVTLTGVSDQKVLDVYEQCLEELHISTLMPDMASEYLVIGRVIASLLFDESKGIWSDIIIQNPDFCRVENIPLIGYSPKVDLKISKEFKKFLTSKDPRDEKALKEIPSNFREELIKKDFIPLDPESTLYIPRQITPYDFMGSSIYYRIIQFFALEKSLVNGTLIAAKRRQRSILHITVGESDLWEPEEEDISSIAGMFVQADEDPQGAIVATRMGVETNELRSGADFWKLSDEWDFLSTAKMRALGINESFLCVSGDTLICTENGICRIDEVVNSNSSDNEEISLSVETLDNKLGKAVKWYYRGLTNIQETHTKSGRLLKTTDNHMILVLTNSTNIMWKKAKNLRLGDLVCVPTKEVVYENKVKIEFDNIETEYVNPSMSFFIGLLVSGIGLHYESNILDFNKELINSYIDTTIRVFGKEDSFTHDIKYLLNNNLFNKFIKLFINTKFEVPKVILKADKECQNAYLAAYLLNYGNISEEGIVYYSANGNCLRQIQIVLAKQGILSNIDHKSYKLYLNKYFSKKLYDNIYKFIRYIILDINSLNEIYYSDKDSNQLFLPTNIKYFLRSRLLELKSNEGLYFLNDVGEKVLVEIDYIENIEDNLYYTKYKNGDYKKLLDKIKTVSNFYYSNLIYLLSLEYFYDEVKTISTGEPEKVYDLTMCYRDKPVFVGNGVVIHNSGDATYNNMETSLSVFIEMLRNFRANLTSKIFYEKLFPTLARVHGFKKRTQAELSHGIRINGSKNNLDSELIIPQIEYHKQLRPEADSMYLDILSTMEEKGVPVPLRTWASSGGLSFDKILEMKDEDIKDRKEVSKWLEITKKEQGGGSAWGSTQLKEKEEAVYESLNMLPIWKDNKFFGIDKKEIAKAFISSSPANTIGSKFKKDPEKLAASNYILYRMDIKNIPFDTSFAGKLASYLKSCVGKYSNKEIKKELIALNSIIRNSKGLKHKNFDEKKDINLYSGYISKK